MKNYVKRILPHYQGIFKDLEREERKQRELTKAHLVYVVRQIELEGIVTSKDILSLTDTLSDLAEANRERQQAQRYINMLNDIIEHLH